MKTIPDYELIHTSEMILFKKQYICERNWLIVIFHSTEMYTISRNNSNMICQYKSVRQNISCSNVD